MRLLNIVVRQHDNAIKMIFETLSFCENEQEAVWHSRNNTAGNILLMLLSLYQAEPFHVKNLKRLDTQELISEESNAFIELHYQNKPYLGKITAVQYQLPYHRSTALDFFAVIDDYLEYQEFDHTLMGHSIIHDKTIEGQLTQPLEDLLQGSLKRELVTGQLAATLLSMNSSVALYQSTLAALSKIYLFARQQNISFRECLDMKRRYLILYTPTDKLLAAPLDHHSQIRMLIEMTQLLLTYRENELTHLVKNLGLEAKKRFFRPAIGQVAHDQGHYNWTYTEWALLSKAKFTIQPDGCLAFDVPSNEAYQEYYAKGKRNHGIFEQELLFLQKYLPLAFHPKTDFHKTIILTPECSALLIQQGANFNEHYIKKLLAMKNTMRFFGKVKEHTASSTDRQLYDHLLALPLEVTALIMGHTFPELAQTLHKNDLIELMKYTNMQADFRLARHANATASNNDVNSFSL